MPFQRARRHVFGDVSLAVTSGLATLLIKDDNE